MRVPAHGPYPCSQKRTAKTEGCILKTMQSYDSTKPQAREFSRVQTEEWVRGPAYVFSPCHIRHLASVSTVSWEVGIDTPKVNDSSRVTEPGSPLEQRSLRGLGALYQR